MIKNKKIITRGKALELSILPNRVALVSFDSQDSRVNLLSSSVMAELESVLDTLEVPGLFTGLVFCSGKPNCFIAGADIKEILQAQAPEVSEDSVFDACQRGKAVLARISALPLPTVAAIHGRCLGGGAELSLACKVRIASNDKSTVIGLPEVGLGVLPGWGGTVRTPKMLGLLSALSLTLNPLRPWSAKKAYRKGLVSAVLPKETLLLKALAVASTPAREAKDKTTLPNRLLKTIFNSRVGRAATFFAAERVIKATIGRKYPAPQAVLKVLAAAFELPEEKALELESRTFAQLCKTDASKRCVQKFLEIQKAKKANSAAH